MKKAINILITLIIIFSSLIVLNELNKKENPLKNSKIEYSITNDSYFNSLSSNDTWIESTIDNDSISNNNNRDGFYLWNVTRS